MINDQGGFTTTTDAGREPWRLTRREWIETAASAGAYVVLGRPPSSPQAELLSKRIPSTGESLPVVGIGTALEHYLPSLTPNEWAVRRSVFREFTSKGGKLVDVHMGEATEEVCGALVRDLGNRSDFFIATKVGFPRDARPADPYAASVDRMNASFRRFETNVIDLMQLPNLYAWRTLLPLLREWKAEGRYRYIGVTVFQQTQHAELETVMRSEQLDFVQLNYSLEDKESEDRLLPLAADRGLSVIVNVPFARGRVFRRVGRRSLPGWAAELRCETTAQVALKFVVSHPAVTCAIPGTYKLEYLIDNLGAAVGPLPDASMRRLIARWYDELPTVG